MNASGLLSALRAGVRGIDRRVFAAQARADLPVADVVLPRLTRVADHSVLWVGVAALVTALGGRRGRRAATRGLSSVALAGLLANQVGKRLNPGVRPSLSMVPAMRIAGHIPQSGSFPSGHSASAAAFAVGASLEMPELAVPLGLLAAAVCWSRVYTGMHYPSDVVVGAMVGALAATVLSRTFPAADVKAGDVTELRPVLLAARPTGVGVVIVVNEGSGPRGRTEAFRHLQMMLPDARIVPCASEDLLATLHAAAERAEIIGVSGGDGSVNAAASVALEHGLALAVLPGGTFNHFARDIGVDSVAQTIRAVQTGSAVQIKVGRVSGADGFQSLFLNTSSVGSYPEFVERRERWQGRIGKPLAAAIAARSVLTRTRPEEFLIDGQMRRVGLIFIGNGSYQPQEFAPAWRPSMARAELDLRLFDARGRLPVTRLIVDFLLGRVGRSPNFHERLGPEIEIRRAAAGLLARDGEIGPAPADLHFDIDPRPLTVMVARQPGERGHRQP